MKSFFTLIFLFLSTTCSFATTYYISASGNDNANGLSAATAWRTISKLNTIKLFPGDIARFEGGATFPGSIIIGADDYGTAAQPVIITSYGTGRALVDAGTSVGILVINTAGVEITNINFMGGAGNNDAGVYITMDRTDSMLQHIVVQDVEVSRFYNYGVLITANNTTKGFKDVLVNRVLSHDNLNGGIGSFGSGNPIFTHQNITVSNSKAYNNKGITGYHDNTGNGIVLTGVEGALIDNCEAYNNGENNTYGGGGPVGIWLAYVKNGIIQNSESHHNRTGTIDGGGFDLDGGCQNCIIQYCYSHDNEGAGYLLAEYGSGVLFTNNIIRYNITENDGTDVRTGGNGGIYIWGGGPGLEVTNSQVYNNTIYTLSGRAGVVLSDSYFTNVKISNNIIYTPAGTSLIQASQDVDSTKAHFVNNNYYSVSTPDFYWAGQTYTSLAAWKAAVPTQERRGTVSYGITANPLLTAPGTGKDGYRLNSSSPMINAGLNLTGCGPRDYYGGVSRVGSAQDMGAHEKQDVSGGDTEAPSVPAAVNALYTGRTFVHLDWNNSTDNVGVTAYDVYVGGVKKYTTTESAITADSLTAGTAYSFTVKALDLAGNSSAFSTAVSATTPTTANGLNYRYYEGGWNTLPNFNALTPVKTGLSPNTDLSIRNKNDSFAVVWEGTINITTPGSYTFETVSDEGSRLYFNSVYKPGAAPLVNNDGLHTATSASGTVTIPAAGLYPIAITYFEKTATESMQVFYTGPGITRQLIANSAFNPPPPGDTEAPSVPAAVNALYTGRTFVHLDWGNSTDNVGVTAYDVYVGGVKKYTTTESAITADSLTAGTAYSFTVKALDLAGNSSAFSTAVSATTPTTANGLNYRYYEGGWNTLPNFNALTPVKTGLSPNTDLSIRNKNDSFAVVWEGTINITTPGSYTFETVSDEGSRLYFNSVYKPGAAPLVNNDGLHTATSASGTVTIPAAGLYPIAITYFEKTATESMQVFYTGPGITRQLIPNSAFNPPPPGDTEAPGVPTNLQVVSAASTSINLDWNDATDNVGVTGYDIYVGGVKRYTSTASQLTADGLTAATSYTFTVKALDLAGNSSAFSAAVTGSTTSAGSSSNGLNYRYYESSSWSMLPNFNNFTPVKTGTTANIDLSVRTTGVNDNYGFVWEGYINITTPGNYTFETVSDDGSKFYFNTLYSPTATALVNNDGLHAPTSVSGTVNIPAAGVYPVSITFFEKDGGETMQLYWTGPGIARQLVPNTAFTAAAPADNVPPSVPTNLQVVSAASTSINLDWNDATDNVGVTGYDIYVGGVKRYTSTASQLTADGLTAATSYTFTVKALDLAGNSSAFSAAVTGSTTSAGSSSNGLNYRYYEGIWSALPNFNTLTPVKTGTTANIDLSVRTPGVSDNFGFVWEGYINITTPGNYTFETVSDDGSRFYFNTLYSPTATALVNNDGLHAPTSVSGTVNIPAAGVYPVSITFFERDGGETMQLYWTGPGITRQLVPNTAFTAAAPADNVPPGVPTNLQVVSAASTSINLDWNDATDNVGVTGYDIYVGGVKRYTSTTSQLTADGLTAATSYTFTVKALDLAGNSSAFSAAVTGSTTSAGSSSNGLNYRYYESSSWSMLPNFNNFTPVKTGTTANIDLSVRTTGVNDNYGFVWEGYINITTPGNYTFETVSDDGSRFYFNTLYSPTATALVNNDGLHAPTSVSGTVNIPAAGVYPVSITFFEKDGGETMQLYWTGPGIARQLVPNTAFTAAAPADNVPPSVPTNLQVVSAASTSINLDWNDATDNVGVTGYDIYVGGVKRYTSTASQLTADGLTAATSYTFTVKALDLAGNSSAFSAAVTGSTTSAGSSSNGLNYRYYEGIWSALPNFNTLTPVKTGTTANIDLSVRTPGVSDNFGFVWEGYINITTPGNYTFETVSDDGSRFYFNTLYSPTATALVNNDGLHAPTSVSGTVNIPAAGVYPVSITFFERDGGETMQLYWTGPGITRQLVPNTAFTTGIGSLISGPIRTGYDADASPGGSGSIRINRVYPNPYHQSFSIDLYNPAAANDIRMSMYDLKGKLLCMYHPGNLSAGNITLKINVMNQLTDGMYLVRLDVNGIPSKVVKVIKK